MGCRLTTLTKEVCTPIENMPDCWRIPNVPKHIDLVHKHVTTIYLRTHVFAYYRYSRFTHFMYHVSHAYHFQALDGPEMLMATSACRHKDSTFRKIYTRDRRGAPMADRLKVGQILCFFFYWYVLYTCPKNHWTLQKGGVWLSVAGFWDLQTTSFEITWFLGCVHSLHVDITCTHDNFIDMFFPHLSGEGC